MPPHQYFMSPRMDGINEQHERAKMFFQEAIATNSALSRFRHMMASLYAARAVVELMLEAADKQEAKLDRTGLEQVIAKNLPRYHLIERIRIHDFHRFGVILQDGFFYGGPIKLKADKGAAVLTIGRGGKQKACTGDSRVTEQRGLVTVRDSFFDDEVGEYVLFEILLKDYVEAIPRALVEFKGLLKVNG